MDISLLCPNTLLKSKNHFKNYFHFFTFRFSTSGCLNHFNLKNYIYHPCLWGLPYIILYAMNFCIACISIPCQIHRVSDLTMYSMLYLYIFEISVMGKLLMSCCLPICVPKLRSASFFKSLIYTVLTILFRNG